MEYKNLIPECYGDTALIESLGYKSPNHQKGIGNVNNIMVSKFANNKAIGIVDNDKNLSRELKNLEIIRQTDALILKKRPASEHYFIVLKPALEKWLIHCESTEVSRSSFNFPEDFDTFAKRVKRKNIGEDQDFVKYLKALKRANPEPIATLQEWLNELLTM